MSNIAFYCTKDHPKYKDTLILLELLQATLLDEQEFLNYLANIKHNKVIAYDSILTWDANQSSNNEYYLAILDSTSHYKKCIYIDYVHNFIAGKQCFNFGYNDALPKAMGLAKLKDKEVAILDGTAGLTIDSYAIARLHQLATVTLLEQSVIIYYLIQDAITRLQNSTHPDHVRLCNRVSLYNINFIDYLENNPHKKFDIIYLDPMFERHTSAKPKKNMQLLQHICSNPSTVEKMLTKALTAATDRVVLKRSKVQSKIFENKINYSVTTKQLRYDVYLA